MMMKMREKMHTPNRKSQQGIVLIVSLLILLVLTMLGISAISNTSMEERMSNNFQQSMVAFQASESTISDVIMNGDETSPSYSNAVDANGVSDDPLLNARNAGIGATTTVTYNANPNNLMNGVAVSTTATISYQGQMVCPLGSSISDVTCDSFEISTDTTVNAATTGQSHVQGILRGVPTPTS